MNRAIFDRLRVIRREHACNTGSSEVCEAPSGEKYIRLRIRSNACQRECLSSKVKADSRLEQGVLEILLPHQDGMLFDRWLAKEPTLAQRREACLALTAQCIELKAAPCVTALAAKTENLRFSDNAAMLQFLPDWGYWSPEDEPARDVSAVAGLCHEVMTAGYTRFQEHCFPPELRLLRIRTVCGGYQGWGQLQQDLSAIPDELTPLARPYRMRFQRAAAWLKKYARPAVCVIVALLLTVAILSLSDVYLTWRSEQNGSWPGIEMIGDQNLRLD